MANWRCLRWRMRQKSLLAPAERRPRGGKADGFEDHAHAALDVAVAVEAHGAAHVAGDAAFVLVGGGFRFVAAVEGVGEFVVFGFGDAAGGDAEAAEDAELFAGEIALHVVVEELEMAVFVGGDEAADLLEDGFGRGFGEGGVVAAGAGFDHAAGDEFAGAAAADGGVGVEGELVAGAVAGEGGFEVPGRVGEGGPAAEGVAVLDFLDGPVVAGDAEVGVVEEDAAEIDGVVGAVAFDHGGGFDEGEDVGVDVLGLELVPCDVVERPVLHDVSLWCRLSCLANGRGWGWLRRSAVRSRDVAVW